jgi:hypothetical protein
MHLAQEEAIQCRGMSQNVAPEKDSAFASGLGDGDATKWNELKHEK